MKTQGQRYALEHQNAESKKWVPMLTGDELETLLKVYAAQDGRVRQRFRVIDRTTDTVLSDRL